jgi:hypothetical protein
MVRITVNIAKLSLFLSTAHTPARPWTVTKYRRRSCRRAAHRHLHRHELGQVKDAEALRPCSPSTRTSPEPARRCSVRYQGRDSSEVEGNDQGEPCRRRASSGAAQDVDGSTQSQEVDVHVHAWTYSRQLDGDRHEQYRCNSELETARRLADRCSQAVTYRAVRRRLVHRGNAKLQARRGGQVSLRASSTYCLVDRSRGSITDVQV